MQRKGGKTRTELMFRTQRKGGKARTELMFRDELIFQCSLLRHGEDGS